MFLKNILLNFFVSIYISINSFGDQNYKTKILRKKNLLGQLVNKLYSRDCKKYNGKF